jgi:hypothetical protein
MRKLFLVVLSLLIIANSFAAPLLVPGKNKLNAKDILLPIANTGNKISLFDLSRIRMGDLQNLSGRQMNFAEKVSFTIAQRKLRNSMYADGTINNKKIQRYFRNSSGQTGFHLGGFALGFLLGLIGIIIAYVIKDQYRRNRIKWAWIGWAVWLALWLTILLA